MQLLNTRLWFGLQKVHKKILGNSNNPWSVFVPL